MLIVLCTFTIYGIKETVEGEESRRTDTEFIIRDNNYIKSGGCMWELRIDTAD